MRLKNKSMEELLDLMEDLEANRDLDTYGVIHNLISVYEEFYFRIKRDPQNEYYPSLEMVKNKLIWNLIHYGTYLKTALQKDDRSAESCLKKALKYEMNLPIAYYRLGFLQYKQENYIASASYYEKAILHHNKTINNPYKLNNQQLYNSYLYLANCGLFIAENAKKSMDTMLIKKVQTIPSSYPISPLFQIISENEQYLGKHEYQIVTNKGMRYGSKEDCDDLRDSVNTIVLDLTSRENLILYNDRECYLSRDQVEMLRLYFIKSSETNPLTKEDFFDLFSRADETIGIKPNTYIQKVQRLRGKLNSVGLENVIINKSKKIYNKTVTGYYYNHQSPFVIMYRHDESFLLN